MGFIKNGIKGNKIGGFTRNAQIEIFQKSFIIYSWKSKKEILEQGVRYVKS